MPTKLASHGQIGLRLKLRALHVFMTVVESGSMAKAAAKLGVTQPSVSEVIADLEHTFGVRLLDRRPQGVEPTLYGAALLKRAQAAFDELQQGGRDIEFLADPSTGELRIGCPDSLVVPVLSDIADHFRLLHPRVTLHVDTVAAPSTRLPGPRERKYDLMLARIGAPFLDDLAEDLDVEQLFDDRLVLAAGSSSRWTSRRKIDLAELVGEPWILNSSASWSYARLSEALRARGLEFPRVNIVTLSWPLVMNYVGNGPFITTAPWSATTQSALKRLPVDLPVWSWPVVILTSKNRTMSPIVERFIHSARHVAKSFSKQLSKSENSAIA